MLQSLLAVMLFLLAVAPLVAADRYVMVKDIRGAFVDAQAYDKLVAANADLKQRLHDGKAGGVDYAPLFSGCWVLLGGVGPSLHWFRLGSWVC